MSDIPAERGPRNSAGLTIRYILRIAWIAVRLAAVLLFIHRGSTFFYQGF